MGEHLLSNSPGGGHVLSTSSSCGTRTLGMMSEDHLKALVDPDLDELRLRGILIKLVDEIHEDPDHLYREIPTVAYGISKMGLNCLTQILARQNPSKYRATQACV